MGSNFYWLSTKPETIDWAKSNWFTTPTAEYADFTALSQLPKVKLKVAEPDERKGEEHDACHAGESEQDRGVLRAFESQ